MKYEFRDDGVVDLKIGATAHNLFSTNEDRATHLHTAWWKVTPVLGGAEDLVVKKVEHDSTGLRTVIDSLGSEQSLQWNPRRFTKVLVESETINNGHSPPHLIGYELVPNLMGVCRYDGIGEEFTIGDIWLTKSRGIEARPRDLPDYVNGETIRDGVTIWHQASVLHISRDEDFGPAGTNAGEGVAITAWAGCRLRPRNFFSSTPLFPK